MTDLMTETDLIAIAERGAAELQGASAEELLAWTDETFGGDYVVASNMQDAVLVAMAAKVRPGVDVLFLDTGYHFAETIGTRDAVEAVYGVNVVNVTPEHSVAQ
nr:phosphoadenosine phosphosulfate reductase family protein [Actinomycetota bacterium]